MVPYIRTSSDLQHDDTLHGISIVQYKDVSRRFNTRFVLNFSQVTVEETHFVSFFFFTLIFPSPSCINLFNLKFETHFELYYFDILYLFLLLYYERGNLVLLIILCCLNNFCTIEGWQMSTFYVRSIPILLSCPSIWIVCHVYPTQKLL